MRPTRRASATAAGAVVFGLAAFIATYLSRQASGPLTPSLCLSISVLSCAALGVAIKICRLWSAAAAFACVMWLFHFGFIASVGLGLTNYGDLSAWDQAWFLGPYASEAAFLALAGFLALISGFLGVRALRAPQIARIQRDSAVAYLDDVRSAFGAVLLIGSISTWAAIVVLAGGPQLLLAAYGDYLQQTAVSETLVSAVWLFMGIGVVLTAAGRDGTLRRGAFVVLVVFAALALPIGLRGELLFPGVAAFVALARLNRALPTWRTFAIAGAVLLSIPVIREVRSYGLAGLTEARLQLGISEALVEMGGSLHPVEKVVRWRAEGDDLIWGGSYWAPVERAAARVLPGLTRENAEDDDRIMNILVARRIGFIGFSPIAEAYRNFGHFGVAAVLLLLGMIVAGIDTIVSSNRVVVVLAAVYLPLLVNVRNSFVSVPAQCVIGIISLAVVMAVRRVMRGAVPGTHTPNQLRSGIPASTPLAGKS